MRFKKYAKRFGRSPSGRAIAGIVATTGMRNVMVNRGSKRRRKVSGAPVPKYFMPMSRALRFTGFKSKRPANNSRPPKQYYINETPGEITFSKYTSGPKRSTRMKRTGAGQKHLIAEKKIVLGTSVFSSSAITYSGRKSLYAFDRGHFTSSQTFAGPARLFDVMNDLNRTTPDVNFDDNQVLDQYFSWESVSSTTSFSNTSNAKVQLSIYELALKRDLPNKKDDVVSANDNAGLQLSPVYAMVKGIKHRNTFAENDGPAIINPATGAGAATAICYMNAHPSQSHLFNHLYAIRKCHKVSLAPGCSHVHRSTIRINQMVNVTDYINFLNLDEDYSDTSALFVDPTTFTSPYWAKRGHYFPLLVEVQSVPVYSNTSIVNYPPVDVAVHHRQHLRYSFVEDRFRSMSSQTDLVPNEAQNSFRVFTNVQEAEVDSTNDQ